VTVCFERLEISKNCDIPEADEFKDDASQFMICMINSARAEDTYGNSGSQPNNEEGLEDRYKHDEICSNTQIL